MLRMGTRIGGPPPFLGRANSYSRGALLIEGTCPGMGQSMILGMTGGLATCSGTEVNRFIPAVFEWIQTRQWDH
jgi:hypothetical protein